MASNQSELPLHVAEEDGRTTVQFPAGTILSEINADQFGRELAALAARHEHPQLVVDLGGVTMLTSTILAKLLTLNGRVRDRGGRLTLCNPSPLVHEVFKVTRLDTILEVHTPVTPLPV
jgi:anti-anti-sigma factor